MKTSPFQIAEASDQNCNSMAGMRYTLYASDCKLLSLPVVSLLSVCVFGKWHHHLSTVHIKHKVYNTYLLYTGDSCSSNVTKISFESAKAGAAL